MQIEFVTAPKIEEVEGAVAVIAYESALSGAGRDFAVARLTPDGALDPAFGSGGKATLDFGAGSGVAAIAAAKAGAAEVVACDLDPLAIASCPATGSS